MFSECFGFGLVFCFLFLNRAILCSVQAVKKNIYQCFPIKYSDYLTRLLFCLGFWACSMRRPKALPWKSPSSMLTQKTCFSSLQPSGDL